MKHDPPLGFLVPGANKSLVYGTCQSELAFLLLVIKSILTKTGKKGAIKEIKGLFQVQWQQPTDSKKARSVQNPKPGWSEIWAHSLCLPTQKDLRLPPHLPKSCFRVKAAHPSSPSASEFLPQSFTRAPPRHLTTQLRARPAVSYTLATRLVTHYLPGESTSAAFPKADSSSSNSRPSPNMNQLTDKCFMKRSFSIFSKYFIHITCF